MQAFISYSREDDTFADLMRMKLKEAGIGTWMDVDTSPGDEWRTRIDDGIKTSDALIVVLSPAACNSPYVTYEWAFAIGYGKRVIPVLLKPAKFHPRLEVFQYLDFQELRMAPWDKLVNAIAKPNVLSETLALNEAPDLSGQWGGYFPESSNPDECNSTLYIRQKGALIHATLTRTKDDSTRQFEFEGYYSCGQLVLFFEEKQQADSVGTVVLHLTNDQRRLLGRSTYFDDERGCVISHARDYRRADEIG